MPASFLKNNTINTLSLDLSANGQGKDTLLESRENFYYISEKRIFRLIISLPSFYCCFIINIYCKEKERKWEKIKLLEK